MDTAYFEQLLTEYIRAANGNDVIAETEAAWECIREAAGLLSVPIPTSASLN